MTASSASLVSSSESIVLKSVGRSISLPRRMRFSVAVTSSVNGSVWNSLGRGVVVTVVRQFHDSNVLLAPSPSFSSSCSVHASDTLSLRTNSHERVFVWKDSKWKGDSTSSRPLPYILSLHAQGIGSHKRVHFSTATLASSSLNTMFTSVLKTNHSNMMTMDTKSHRMSNTILAAPIFSKNNIKRVFSATAKKRDFYEVLGVSKTSDKATIKKAYFKLAKKYHPDTNQGDSNAAEKFKEVTEAYEILSDDKQRELYDAYGHAGVDPNAHFGGPGAENPFGQGAGGFQGFHFGDGSFHFTTSGSAEQIDPEDLFEAFFGRGNGSRRKRGPRRGADLQSHLRLSFREAVFGVSKDLNVKYQVVDPKTGQIELKDRQVTVEVPAGIDNGMNLRLSGQGGEGSLGGARGNLIVTVVVEEDDYFHREGVDVHVDVPISFIQAVLGGTVEVKTLDGTVEMKIPKGSQPDAKLLMRGKGIPYVNGRERGNQIVHLKIQIPKVITPRQEELLREFDQETEKSGLGICGRLASAAGSAFDTLFRGGKKKDTDPPTENNVSSSSKDEEKFEEGESKKQVAS